MTGRDEMERSRFKDIEKRLEEYPEYVNDWYLHLRANGKTASTCDIMTGKIGTFLSFINPNKKEVQPEQITAQVIERYLIKTKTKEKDGKTQSTSFAYQQSVWSCLKSFLQFMAKRKLIPENYIETQEITVPNRKDEVERPYLTGKDFTKIIKTVSKDKEWDDIRNRDTAILAIFMNTGIRLSALCSINIEDIDMENGYLTVIDKGEKSRKCKLNESTLKAVEDWLEVREYMLKLPWENALFVTETGHRIQDEGTRKAIKKRCKEAGYDLTPHMLRGGYITILQEATGDINFVCDAVGHSNISTTKRYIRNNGKQSEVAADIMAKAIKF